MFYPPKRQKNRPFRGSVLIGCCVFVNIFSCERKEIHSYRVAKEQVRETRPKTSNPPARQPSKVTWTVPDGWEKIDKQVPMRYATFITPQNLEVTVAVFPGDVGGLLANVNRWRGQVGLESIEEHELERNAVQISGKNSYVVDIEGLKNRLISTSVSLGDGSTWFVKTIGNSSAAGQIKADMVTFSESFRIVDSTKLEEASTPSVEWKPPATWSIDQNASSMLMAAYVTELGARITLTALGGDGGGLLNNVNRWRGQLGLESKQSVDELNLQIQDGTVVVDLVSLDGLNRIVVGIISLDSKTLFFKLMGSPEATQVALKQFTNFILSFTSVAGNSN